MLFADGSSDGRAAAWAGPVVLPHRSRGDSRSGCDWTLGKPSDPAAFDVAKEIGLDGVQVDMGTVANECIFASPKVQKNPISRHRSEPAWKSPRWPKSAFWARR